MHVIEQSCFLLTGLICVTLSCEKESTLIDRGENGRVQSDLTKEDQPVHPTVVVIQELGPVPAGLNSSE